MGALKILTEKPREVYTDQFNTEDSGESDVRTLVGLAPDWRLLDADMLDTVVPAEENMSNVFEKN